MLSVASYPGLLTPAFVTCSINVGEGLVKLITCNDIPTHWVDVVRSGTFLLYSCKVAFWTQEMLPRLSGVNGAVILQFFWEYATSPHVHPTFRYIIARDQCYQAFPHVSTAGNKRWGEKAWVRGYAICTQSLPTRMSEPNLEDTVVQACDIPGSLLSSALVPTKTWRKTAPTQYPKQMLKLAFRTLTLANSSHHGRYVHTN